LFFFFQFHMSGKITNPGAFKVISSRWLVLNSVGIIPQAWSQLCYCFCSWPVPMELAVTVQKFSSHLRKPHSLDQHTWADIKICNIWG
jgi:hypothetical protein